MTLPTILCRMVLVDNIGTNTFGAKVLRIKRIQSDAVILERITDMKESIFELILPFLPRKIIILSNTTHDIINGNAVHTNSPFYYIIEGYIEISSLSAVNFGTVISSNLLKLTKFIFFCNWLCPLNTHVV